MVDIFSSLTTSFSAALPSLIAAIIFIVVGFVVGVIVKFIVSSIIRRMNIDEWFEQQNLLAAIGNKHVSDIVGTILKWYIFFVFLKQAIELVNLTTLNTVLGFWIQYAILVIVAAGVIIAGLIIGRFARNAIEASKYYMSRLLGLVFELMIVYIAVVMGISIIGLPTNLLEYAFLIAFAGVVLSVSIMIGIGFGFAIKDEAKTIVKELKKTKK